jgi:NAD-dependent deacetylase
MNDELNKKEIERLKRVIDESEKNSIVFFGGAGVSTESGIPDFRSTDGLYNQEYKYPPETIISHSFLKDNPEEFFRFYRDKMLITWVKPNAAHYALAKLEKQGKLSAVVTQNIDGLHQKAGSVNVFELHGSIYRNYCEKCRTKYEIESVLNSQEMIPRCDACGGIIRPDVTLYEEPLLDGVLISAMRAISNASTLIVGGTSLVVQPAASLIEYFHGKCLVVINKTHTYADSHANIVIHEPIAEVMNKVVA